MTADNNEGSSRSNAPGAKGRAGKIVAPVAALLFAAASVLQMMGVNTGQWAFPDVAPALFGALGFAILVWLIVGALRRRFDAATAVITAFWVVAGLYYGILFRRVEIALGGGFDLARSLPLAAIAMILLTLFWHRRRRSLADIHLVLTCIGVAVLLTPTLAVIDYEWNHGAARAAYDADRAGATMPLDTRAPAGEAAGTDRMPNIYHFVFDRYASPPVLRQYYGVEPPIVDFLRSRGFYVAEFSHSNYHKTAQSLAATFYMDYLDDLARDPRVKGFNYQPLFEMLSDHRVGRFLRAKGYKIIQFGSWWTGTFHSRLADENHPLGFSEFNMYYLGNTLLRPLFALLPDSPWTMRLDWDLGQCQRVARQVERIKATAASAQPLYVFAHFLVPHPPYNFAKDGSCLSFREFLERDLRQGYLDQVEYANQIIQELVIALQANDNNPPIIIIQSDEGPFPNDNEDVIWTEAPVDSLRIKTGVLNAIYFHNQQYALLSPDISPVNTYRILFNTYFGTEFPMLPDRVLVFPTERELYDFHDVTERVRCAADGSRFADQTQRSGDDAMGPVNEAAEPGEDAAWPIEPVRPSREVAATAC